jgi:hypothetical protein
MEIIRKPRGQQGSSIPNLAYLRPSRRVAVVVVTTDDAGVDLSRDFAWAELTRLTGLRRARLVPAARTAVATLRGAVASVVAAAAPRTLSS